MKMNSVIFREYDIRGVFESDFDCDFAFLLGRAFVSYIAQRTGVKQPTVTLGHDARLSSPDISKALSKGLTQSGARVLHLGLVTSPISYFSTFTVPDVSGAIMVTGSHNPPEYNGFKISFGKSTIHGQEIKRLEAIINQNEFLNGDGREEPYDILTPYVERYKQEFRDMPSIPFVLDCGNGAAGKIARRLYEAIGLKPTILFEEPDGTFPNHHPDPTVESNLVALKKQVLSNKARLGIGFDGDADRIGLVDDQARFVPGDEMMAFISSDVLTHHQNAKIIGDVKCSDRLYNFIRERGGNPIMWKTGHSLIKEKVKLEKAPFGGELSGHIFFADRNYGYDDALYAGLRVVEILARTGRNISDLLEGFPPSFSTPEIRIDTTEEKKHAIVETLKTKFAAGGTDFKANLIDGIRISYTDGWALARASNTQPVLVLRFESTSEAGLKRIRKIFEDVVNPLL